MKTLLLLLLLVPMMSFGQNKKEQIAYLNERVDSLNVLLSTMRNKASRDESILRDKIGELNITIDELNSDNNILKIGVNELSKKKLSLEIKLSILKSFYIKRKPKICSAKNLTEGIDHCEMLYNKVPFTGVGVNYTNNGVIEYTRYENGCDKEWLNLYKNGSLKNWDKGWCCSETSFSQQWDEDGDMTSLYENGVYTEYYKNGNKSSERYSEDMGCTNYEKSYYENGQIKSSLDCKGCVEISADLCELSCWDSEGNKVKCTEIGVAYPW